MTTRLKKQTSRKNAVLADESSSRSSVITPPALTNWLNSQRNLGNIHPTALELARSIKRNLFAE